MDAKEYNKIMERLDFIEFRQQLLFDKWRSYTASPSYKSIKNILVTGSVKQESEVSDSKTTRKAHGITRGADYYRR